MTTVQNIILTKKQVKQKIRRIAYEIYENNFGEKELIIAGIHDQGFVLAEQIAGELHKISSIKARLVKISINKSSPSKGEVAVNCELKDLRNKSVILVDDVLNTGKTMSFSLKAFLSAEIKKIEAAVLVDRSHKLFPVDAKYKGYELSTTIKDHVEVRLKGSDQGVFLY